MDDWHWSWLLTMLEFGFNSKTQTCKAETKTNNSKKQEFGSDTPKSEKAFIYGIGPNSVPYEKFLRVTAYTEIQEGEFTEIENTEASEIAVRELADQAADRGKEILRNEANEGRMQGGGEETVCGLRDREEEPNDGRGSD